MISELPLSFIRSEQMNKPKFGSSETTRKCLKGYFLSWVTCRTLCKCFAAAVPRPLPFSQNWCGAHYVAPKSATTNHASSCLMCYVTVQSCCWRLTPKEIDDEKALIMHLNHVAFLKDSKTLLHVHLAASFSFLSEIIYFEG